MEGYVTHEPYRGVRLTAKGLKIALQVLRKHRLSERLLTDVLRMSWDEVHEAACKLEHGMNNKVAKTLENVLNRPKTCPHGNPIPTINGEIPEEKSQPLNELQESERAIIVKITEEKSELLHYLKKQGLIPGASVEVVEIAPFDGPITLRVDSSMQAVSRAVASVIQVKKLVKGDS
jgi:DtxR family Mn-dependent transcriptional regulator